MKANPNLYNIITLESYKSTNIIHELIIHPLKVNRDDRGTLTEALKITWDDVYSEALPFAQMYFSTTDPGVARDEGKWHYHPGGQQDRFGVIVGDIVVAVLDNRDDSPTNGLLNLFHMGTSLGDDGQYLVVIPPRTLHGYVVVSKTPATMFNFPSKVYDSKEEIRLSMKESVLEDGTVFSYEKVKQIFG